MSDIDYLRLAELTEDDLRCMDQRTLARVLSSTQRALRGVQGHEAERRLLALSRRANLVAAGLRCEG